MNQKRALVLINHRSRQGADVAESARLALESAGLHVTAPEKADPSNFSKIIREHADKVDLVIVGAGDGGIRCSLAGLIETKLPLGVLALGTANNLARNLSIPTDLTGACKTILEGKTRTIDVAQVNEYLFLNVAGIGLSARVNETVPHEAKKRWGVVAFMATAFQRYRELKPFRAQITSDGGAVKLHRHKIVQMHVCNGKFFGSGMTIDPDASIDDGELDLAITESVDVWQGIRIIREFFRPKGKPPIGLMRIRAKEAYVETKKTMQVDVDGDLLTQTPARFKIHRQALQVFAP